jgi:hypothetical protein
LNVPYTNLHLSVGAESETVREKMKRLKSLLDDFTIFFSGFYASLFYTAGWAERKERRCVASWLLQTIPFIHIYLNCCGLVASGSDDMTVRLWNAERGAARQTLEGSFRLGQLSGLLARQQAYAYSFSV